MLRDIIIGILTVGITITLATAYIIVYNTTVISLQCKRWTYEQCGGIDVSHKTPIKILSIGSRK